MVLWPIFHIGISTGYGIWLQFGPYGSPGVAVGTELNSKFRHTPPYGDTANGQCAGFLAMVAWFKFLNFLSGNLGDCHDVGQVFTWSS